MLAIGRALVAKPTLLLLDEPSLGLSPLLVQEIFHIVEAINRDEKVSILLVEQNARSALSIADEGIVLSLGEVVVKEAAAALASDANLRHHYLGF